MIYLNTVKQLFCVNIVQKEMFISCDYDINYKSC